MHNHYCWDNHRQVHPDSSAHYATSSSRVEYPQQVYCGHGVPVANSENDASTARPYRSNESWCTDACCRRDRKSLYGGYSSTFPETAYKSRFDGGGTEMTLQMGQMPV